MCNEIRGNEKHMSLEDSNYIKKALIKEITFKKTDTLLRKNPTTISKEIGNTSV